MKLILKLIETTRSPVVGDLVYSKTIDLLFVVAGLPLACKDAIVLEPYGISENEIKEGDTVLCYEDKEYTKFVGISVVEEAYTNNQAWCSDDYYDLLNYQFYCKKVILTPNQFNNQDIIELELKDGDTIEIMHKHEYICLHRCDSKNSGDYCSNTCVKFKPHTVNGHVLINIPDKPQPVTYTEEEVYNLFGKWCSEIFTEDGILRDKSPVEVYKWFEQNKKK